MRSIVMSDVHGTGDSCRGHPVLHSPDIPSCIVDNFVNVIYNREGFSGFGRRDHRCNNDCRDDADAAVGGRQGAQKDPSISPTL